MPGVFYPGRCTMPKAHRIDFDELKARADFRAVMAETVMKLFSVDPIKAGTMFPGYKPHASDYLNFMKQVKMA